MPYGQLTINGKDAYLTWGISLSSTALSTLMTPPPMKSYVENSNRLKHGKSMEANYPRYDVREITITFNLVAKNASMFYSRYEKFCKEVLSTGKVNILTSFQPQTEYKCLYVSCTQFSEYVQEMAVFALKLVEPNPDNRVPEIHIDDESSTIRPLNEDDND